MSFIPSVKTTLLHVVSFCLYSSLLLLFPECYRDHPALSFLHTGLRICRCFVVFGVATRTQFYLYFLAMKKNKTHKEGSLIRCVHEHGFEVCGVLLARLWTALFQNLFPHILVGCATPSRCPFPLAVRPWRNTQWRRWGARSWLEEATGR